MSIMDYTKRIRNRLFPEEISTTRCAFLLLLIMLPATFPFHHRVSSLMIVAVGAMWLFSGEWRKIKKLFDEFYLIVLLLIFLIPVLSLVYSTDKSFSLIERRIPLLVLPVMLYASHLTAKNVERILRSFVLGCSIAAGYSLLYSLYINYQTNGLTEFIELLYSTEMTTEAIGISHVYFGMYLSFAIIVLLYSFTKKGSKKRIYVVNVILVMFLLFVFFLIGGKMSIISLFLLLLSMSFLYIVKAKQWLLGMILLVLPIATFYITIAYSSYTKGRFLELVNPQNYFVGDNAWNSIGVRISIFKCTYESFLNAPILGTGIGDLQPDLNECYKSSNFLSIMNMNPHNQYLQVLLGNGIIGFLLFCFVLVYGVVTAFSKKKWLCVYFIFIFSFCCLTESILERQQGIIFWAFFISLLYFNPIPNEGNYLPEID